MKLRTSFFNPTVLKKDITRYSPLWVLYTVFMFLFLLLMWESESSPARFVNNASYVMAAMAVLNFFYAGIAAILLFSDLFTPRMTNMLHALPLRREGWFLTHLTAGMLFCLVPNLLGGLITAAMLGQYAYGAFAWLAVSVLEYLFFFGVGVFCVMCAGNALGAIAVYGIVNFFWVLAAWLVKVFYEPALYGMEIDLALLADFSPVVGLSDFEFIDTFYDSLTRATTLNQVYTEQWLYLAVAAVLGIGLLAAALFVYRKRQLETAGDFISFKYVSPVFLGIYTLLVGAMIYTVGDALSHVLGSIFLFIGLAIGFFTGLMLLEKQIRVFRWKNILAFAISLAVFLSTIGLTVLDPIGITRYVPEAKDVAKVTISPYGTYYSIYNQSCILTESNDVQTVIDLHNLALESRYDQTENTLSLHIQYKLKNGTTVERSYELPETDETVATLQGFYSRPACVLGTDDPEVVLKTLRLVEFYPYEDGLPILHMSGETFDATERFGKENPVIQFVVTGSFANDPVARGLVEAIYADCEAGVISRWRNEYDTVGSISIEMETGGYRTFIDIPINTACTNTLAYLKSLNADS